MPSQKIFTKWIIIITLLTLLSQPYLALAQQGETENAVCPPLNPTVSANTSSSTSITGFVVDTATTLVGALLPKPETSGPINILLLGSDSRSREKMAYGRTDAMLILTLNPQKQTAGALSIPRDLWVNIPGYGQNRINQAFRLGQIHHHSGGGPALAMETISANFGIAINHYLLVDFEGFGQAVDALGGIDLCVPHKIDAARHYGHQPKYINPTEHYSFVPVSATLPYTTAYGTPPMTEQGYQYLYLEAGWQTVDGATALQYARSRAAVTADFARVQQQQAILLAIKDKALRLDILPKLPDLWSALSQNFQSDLSLSQAITLLQQGLTIPKSNIQMLALSHPHTQGQRTGAGASVRVPLWPQIDGLTAQLFDIAPVERPVPDTGLSPIESVSSVPSINNELKINWASLTNIGSPSK